MNTKQAKDFLVQEAAEQAVRENAPLSSIEKEMMYFTESDPASCPDPIGLNDRFEAEYEMYEYEAKIRGLLDRAHERIRGEGAEAVQNWDEALRTLKAGDHYVLVLGGWLNGGTKAKGPSRGFLWTLAVIGIVVLAAILAGLLTKL